MAKARRKKSSKTKTRRVKSPAAKHVAPPISSAAAAYEQHKERARERQAAQGRSGRDIGPLPPVADLERRAAAAASLQVFCETYYSHVFHLGWSADHLAIIAKLEQVVSDGGQLAWAQPRGSGKTSLTEAAIVWAACTGRRRFVVAVGASEDNAAQIVESIRAELESNDLLAADWPEVCYPIRRLEGLATRTPGQLLDGKRTRIRLGAKELVLPTVAGSPASGTVIRAVGMTGSLRGLKHEGRRPDLALLDDVQTDQSARSPAQVQRLESMINGAVLGLAGPGQRIAAVALCTVISTDDLADRLLDRKRNPVWQGERFKLMYAMPTSEKLWEQYAELRAEGLRRGDGGRGATVFYAANQAAMDAGAKPAWADRHNSDEVSAIQHAMNIKLDRGDAAFAAEYQNEPLLPAGAEELLTSDDLAAKVHGLKRGIAPLAATHITSFIDVQGKCLWWAVCAWGDGFTGAVLDYGAWPDQGRVYFTLASVKKTLARAKPGVGLEGQIYHGLEQLTGELLDRVWVREDGADMHITRLLIDAGWGDSTSVVRQFCRESRHSAIVMPSFGRGVTADRRPISEYTKKPGDRLGQEWYMPAAGKGGRHLIYDANYWKSFVHQRLAQSAGDRGNVSLYQAKPAQHRMIAEHLTAERPVMTTGGGRVVNVWKQQPGRDNHLADCVVGCAVAASEQGLMTVGHQAAPKPTPRRRRRVEVTF